MAYRETPQYHALTIKGNPMCKHLELEKLIDVSEDDPILRNIEKMLEENGHVEEVDHDHFQEFAQLTDEEISAMMRFIIYARADAINALSEKAGTKDRDLFELVRKTLLLMARGWLWCGDGYEVLCAKPVGPAPTGREWNAIKHRIDLAYPLIGEAYKTCAKASREQD